MFTYGVKGRWIRGLLGEEVVTDLLVFASSIMKRRKIKGQEKNAGMVMIQRRVLLSGRRNAGRGEVVKWNPEVFILELSFR